MALQSRYEATISFYSLAYSYLSTMPDNKIVRSEKSTRIKVWRSREKKTDNETVRDHVSQVE